jgi:excisionase family DNA binding protein
MTQLLDQTLLSTKDASALSGYNADYLSRLCRSGKIVATQVGRTWLVNRASLEEFVLEQENRKREIATELSQSREQEYRAAQEAVVSVPGEVTASATATASTTKFNPRAKRAVRSPFVALLRKPAVALVASFVIFVSSAYAGTIGPVAQIVNHAGSIASSVQQALTGSQAASEPKLRVASSIASQARAGIPATRTVAMRPLKPVIDGDAIASRLALIDAPDARAETGHRIVAYDSAASAAVAVQDSRARTERAFERFIHDDTPITTRASLAYLSIGTGIRDFIDTSLAAYGDSLNRDGDYALNVGTSARDAVAFAPRVSGWILDTYANGVYAWVNNSHVLIARTADTETAAGPVVIALVTSAAQESHVAALALQAQADKSLSALHGVSSLAYVTLDSSLQQGLALRPNISALPVLPTLAVNAGPENAPASVGTTFPAAPLNGGRSVALATYRTIHGWSQALSLGFNRFLAFFRGNSRLAVVPLPPAVTVPGFAYPSGELVETGATSSRVHVTTGATYVSNYFTVNGVTKAMLDQALEQVHEDIVHGLRNSSGGGGSAVSSTGDLTLTGLTVNGNAQINGALTSTGPVTASYFVATSLTATSTLPNLTVNSFSIAGDYITDFTGSGLAIVNGKLTATATTSNSFQQGGNAFGSTATLGTTDSNPLAFITNNLTRYDDARLQAHRRWRCDRRYLYRNEHIGYINVASSCGNGIFSRQRLCNSSCG